MTAQSDCNTIAKLLDRLDGLFCRLSETEGQELA